ncbi:MAG: SPOR domain-containing protein [Sphingobium sp.]
MRRVLGAWAAGTALVVATPVLADVKTGVDAWQQGDYAKAIGEWRPLAQAGDPDAQFNMGQAYKLGRGVQPDLNSAIDWYRRAATQGHLRAEDNLGLVMFQQGDRTNALPYLQKAAGRGEARAQYIVGTALFNGDLLSKDWVRAYAMMTRASASGLPQAATSLQQMDKYIPEDQRKQGLALAATMENTERSVALAAAQSPVGADAPAVRQGPSSVRTTDVPPSGPYQPPVAPAQTARPVMTATPAPVRPAPTPAPPAPVRATPPAASAQAAPSKRTPAPAPSGNWRVQLGAFGDESNARALWTRLSRRVNGLSAYQPYLVKSGAVTRLQAGPLASSADAARLCGAVKAAGADCIPRKK